MILLDTHAWVVGAWRLKLARELADVIDQHESDGIGVSAISCWEVAKLVEYDRLSFPCPLHEWMDEALAYPGVELIGLSPRIAIESTQLPPPFHRDPADQILVATARVLDVPFATLDQRIRAYPHVRLLPTT